MNAKKKRTRGPIPGGSPRGWSFWSCAEQCWRKFLLKYICGLEPVEISDPLVIGTIYHALLDNWAPEAIAGWGPKYAEHIELGKRLYDARLKGPPLPKATASEKQHTLAFGMTSKPDREEKTFGGVPTIRDFKSTAFFSENDEYAWNTNGGIIGEALAVGASKAIVDVICKASGDSFGRVQQFEIDIDERHKEALEQAVQDARSELHMRVEEALAAGMHEPEGAETQTGALAQRQTALRASFPKRLSSCVGKYGLCDYYHRCWSDGPEKHLFKVNEKRAGVWLDDEADAGLETKVKKVRALFSKGVV